MLMWLTFDKQIASVARRINRRRRATAACWAFAAGVATLLGLILLDWLAGVNHIAGRLVLTAILLAALAAIYRRAIQAISGQVTTPLAVALELERLYPAHRGLLASGLEFSQQEADDATAGSLELRRAAVLRASLAVESIDLAAAVARQPLRHAISAAIAAAIALALPAAIAPQTFSTGVTRLLNPLSDAEWPRRHNLAFVDPPGLIPTGSDFVTLLRDRSGELPPSVEVEFRTRRQGQWQHESQTYAASGEAIEIRRPNVQESFEFRARGGDHKSMPWQRVETAPAPQISSLRVTAQPPAYTGLPEEALREPIRIWTGTTLTLHVAANRAAESATLEAEGETAVPLIVAKDGRTFETLPAGWRPRSTAEWSIVLTTAEGMTAVADRRLFVEVAPDRPPTVEIAEPTQDLVVLPEAIIDIAITADDDLAVKAVSLRAMPKNGAETDPTRVELYTGAEQPERGSRSLDYMLEASKLAPQTGTEWALVAHASDYAGQHARSRPLRLRIISRDEFIRRVDSLIARLTTTLRRSLDIQRESRFLVGELLGNSSAAKANTAANAASLQRQVGQTVANSPESALTLAKTLAEEYRRNQWPDARALADAEFVRARLGDLASGPLAKAEEGLTRVARMAQSSSDTEQRRAALSNVRGAQDEIIIALESLLRDLSQASEIQRFQRDLAELKREQSELLKKTETLARDALLNPGEVTRQQRQAQQQAIAGQRQLAANLAGTLGRMKASAADLATAKPGDALRLEAAVDAAEESQLQARARDAADQLAAARFGQATTSQRAVVEQLQQTLNQMTEGGEQFATDRLEALKEAEQRLENIRRNLNSLQDEPPQRPSRELAQQTIKLANDLDQMEAENAAQLAREAAEQLANGDAPKSAHAARQNLDDAQQQLAAERQRQEELLSRLQTEQRSAARSRHAVAERPTAEQATLKRGMKPGEGAGVAKTQAAGQIDRTAVGSLVKDIWGELPERQREELLQPLSEEFLPEYAQEIEEYFRVLAETAADANAEEKQP